MLEIYTDGGSRGNPGPAACAFVVIKDGKEIFKKAFYLGKTTNNASEYYAVIFALDWLIKNNLTNDIKFFLDSELVVKQLTKIYKIRNKDLKKIYNIIIKKLEKNFKNYSFVHINREKNRRADFLVNKILDEKRSVSRQF